MAKQSLLHWWRNVQPNFFVIHHHKLIAEFWLNELNLLLWFRLSLWLKPCTTKTNHFPHCIIVCILHLDWCNCIERYIRSLYTCASIFFVFPALCVWKTWKNHFWIMNIGSLATYFIISILNIHIYIILYSSSVHHIFTFILSPVWRSNVAPAKKNGNEEWMHRNLIWFQSICSALKIQTSMLACV